MLVLSFRQNVCFPFVKMYNGNEDSYPLEAWGKMCLKRACAIRPPSSVLFADLRIKNILFCSWNGLLWYHLKEEVGIGVEKIANGAQTVSRKAFNLYEYPNWNWDNLAANFSATWIVIFKISIAYFSAGLFNQLLFWLFAKLIELKRFLAK